MAQLCDLNLTLVSGANWENYASLRFSNLVEYRF